jgi:protoporphyrinogen oxidase
MTNQSIIILGAGPTGMGAAHRLQELGREDFLIFDKNSYAGGLATTFQDNKGFWWDIGGHVQFSHYSYFDNLMNKLLPNEWLDHERVSQVWIEDRWVPYPFQNNIHKLPKEVMTECLNGLIDLYKNPKPGKPANFEDWILRTQGEGIAKHFMFPYNFKVWAHEPKMMNADWVGERAAVTDLSRVIGNILENKDDVSWGPNNTFRFPKNGGTGEIWKRLAEKIGADKFRLNKTVTKINTTKKQITFQDGEKVTYEHLISTIPLDKLVQMSDLPKELQSESKKLLHSSTHIFGVGLEGKPNKELSKICWMYFPEKSAPFYRATLFSKYSPNNVPDIKKHWSLMLEVSESDYKPVNQKTVMKEVIDGLYNTKLITKTDKIISKWYHREEHGYPIPSTERNAALQALQPELMRRQVYSRGRFGMWKYEVANQDHSLMQGVEAANFIVLGIPELTAWYPNIVNGPKPY